MIDQALALALKHTGVSQADAMLRDTDRLELKFESGRLKESARGQEAGVNLRIVAGGRVGLAGSTDLGAKDAAQDLLTRALASAEQGESTALAFPSKSAPPAAHTFDDRAAGLAVGDLAALGKRVVEQLQRPGWQVNAGVERTVETTRVINSAGQDAAYRSTGISLAADVTRVQGDDVLMVYDHVALVGVPSDAELDALVASIVTRIERAQHIVAPPPGGRMPVLFTPTGSEALLLPVRQALSGKTVLQGVSPLGGKIGTDVFDPAISLTDEPLLDGKVGSRPVDDEGVPSRRLPLVERGTVCAFVYDLETAARAGTASTGHGQRSVFGKPVIGFSNLVVAAGAAGEASLLKQLGSGLIVDELIGVGQGNVVSGAFSHPVALAYRVENGEITGRVKDAAVAGNAYELLKRVVAVGAEVRWIGGARQVPPLLLDGVSVAGR